MSQRHLIDKQLKTLPWYVKEYIQYKSSKSTEKTLLEYLRDFNLFFNWLKREGYSDTETVDTPLLVLEKLKVKDIGFFESYCIVERGNMKDTIARRLNSLKSLFHYLSQIAEDDDYYPYLKRNVMAKIKVENEKYTENEKTRKITEKILVDDEIEEFRRFIEKDYYESIKDDKRRANYYERNKERDNAIASLVLGSGMRVSEVVGIDIDKIDWKQQHVSVRRKGQKLDTIFFSDHAAETMKSYLAIRDVKYKPDKNEKAFFLSLPNKTAGSNRMSISSVQKMIKKYAAAFGKSSLSIHKLRHTFATNHYKENKDIKTLQVQLGHGSVDTTSIYTHVFDNNLIDSVNNADKKKTPDF